MVPRSLDIILCYRYVINVQITKILGKYIVEFCSLLVGVGACYVPNHWTNDELLIIALLATDSSGI